ncbi:MAG: HAD family hydrolase [Chloroflexota bacterium]|nr:HAD family hydrolase [Chloroflexota bacterium]
MKLPGVRWVFFDVGYTLINEDDALWDRIYQIQKALNDCGVTVSTEEVRTALENSANEQANAPVAQAISNLTGSKELVNRLAPTFTWRKDLEKPYPDAEHVLSVLSKRYCIGVIANQSAGTEARLDAWGLLRYVSEVVASAETGLAKPDLAIFKLAIERAGCQDRESVMVGDRIDNDIVPAKALGLKTIRIRQGLSRSQVPIDSTQKPDFEVRQLGEILEILL